MTVHKRSSLKQGFENIYHSFMHFHTRFSYEESRGSAALGGLGIPHDQQQFQV